VRRFDDTPLRSDEFVISADEKTSIQARVCKHDTTAAASGQPMRIEHECARGGALAYFAAWDVHRAKVFGRCEAATGIDPFDRLVEQVMTNEPYASARRRVLGGRQRLAPSWSAQHRPNRAPLADPAPDPPAHPCLLAQPSRDLLFRGPAQSRDAQRLPLPR
jgi:hypothetical protein